MRKALWIGLIVALAGGAGWWGWSRLSGDQANAAPATYTVTRGDVEQSVLASGQLEALALVSVGAQVSGTIETLAVQLGETVAAGDLIAQIDSLEQQNALLRVRSDMKRIEAQIAARQANLRVAQLGYERQQALFDRGSATREALEAAEAGLQVLQAELQQLEAEKSSAEIAVAQAELALSRTRIIAPIAGTVVAIVTEQGQTVNANQSAPIIVKLAQLDRMVVKAEISEADVIRTRPGQEARFTVLGAPELTFNATLRDVEPAPAAIRDSNTISTDSAIYYNGLFDIDNADRLLRIGMTAEVSIQLAAARDVLVLPSAALGRRAPDGSHVVTIFAPGSGATEQRRVKVGLNNNIRAEIVEGLAEGEQVLASGAAAGLARATVNRTPRGMMGF